MSKFVNAVILGLVSFVLILAVFWYVVEIRQDSQVAITDVAVGWGSVNNRTTEVKVRLTLYNPHKSPVLLEDVTYEVVVNGNLLEDGNTSGIVRIEPESEGIKEFTAIVPSRFVVDWMDSHLENDERTRMQVRGEARFAISTLRTIATYAWESQWEGLYVDGFSGRLKNCDADPPPPFCLASTLAAWDTTGTQSVLELTSTLNNRQTNDVKIRSWSLDLVFHGVVVAKGGTPGTFDLPAQGQTEIGAPVVFERLQLPLWWPAHVGDCEKSPSTIVIRFVVEERRESSAEPGVFETVLHNIRWDFEAPRFDTRFVCSPT